MLTVIRSGSAEDLLSELASRRDATFPDDPMQPEVLLVPTRGLERWISQKLSLGRPDGEGITANIEYHLLERFVFQLASIGTHDESNSWSREGLFWAVASVVEANSGAEWLELVEAQIAAGTAAVRPDRAATFRYLRDILDTYHWQRPGMVIDWVNGYDVDAAGQPLTQQRRWQPQLWRAVREHIGQPSPPERVGSIRSRLRDAEVRAQLPQRLSVFELTRLPLGQLELLVAVAEVVDVDLYALHPSPTLWEAVSAALRPDAAVERELAEVTDLAVNPLLSSWGSDVMELQRSLCHLAPAAVSGAVGVGRLPQNTSTLRMLQADIMANREPQAGGPLDRSVQIHGCHGPRRQVEVLRDAVLRALSNDDTLQPRDIVVMCPDIEAFSPHIHAVFGGLPNIRVRLADRAVAAANPMMAATDELLALLDSRCTSVQVLSFLGLAPVRQRFGFDDDALERIAGWLNDAGVRWGIDAEHRQAWHVDAVATNTWSAGMARIAVGAAMADEGNRLINGVRPIDDVTSSDLDLAASLAVFVQRLRAAVHEFAGPFTVQQGLARLTRMVEEFFEPAHGQEWMRTALMELIDDMAKAATAGAATTQVYINEFRDLFSDQLRTKPSRENFRSGDITFATLTPMRSVPYRVVCLLGMDDRAFPRVGRGRGDDLTYHHPQIGDRDPRSEDRQLLLDALMAAQDQFVVVFANRDERTNEQLHPCVPVAELDATLVRMSDDEIKTAVTDHPLQSFDIRNFTKGAVVRDDYWSFSHRDLAASRALAQQLCVAQSSLVDGDLSHAMPNRIDVEELRKFVTTPVRTFFHQSLRLRLTDFDIEVPEDLPLDDSQLVQWSLSQELLAQLLHARAEEIDAVVDRWRAATVAGGLVAPGVLGERTLTTVATRVRRIDQVRRQHITELPTVQLLRTELPDGTVVHGGVNLTPSEVTVSTTPSRILCMSAGVEFAAAKRILPVWVDLLVAACCNGSSASATVIGRGARGDDVAMIVLRAPQDPVRHLNQIVSLYREALNHPLPILGDTSSAAAHARTRLAKVVDGAWTTRDFPKDDQDPYHLLAFGEMSSVDLVNDVEFLDYARRLWGPVVEHSELRRPNG